MDISIRLVIFSLSLTGAAIAVAVTDGEVARLHAQLAAAEQAGDKAAIVELSRRIVTITPNNVAAWEELVRGQLELGDLEHCEQTLQAWTQAMPQLPPAIEDFRGDLSVRRKDYANAERHWLAFLARKPAAADAADMYDKLADLCVAQERWKDNALYRRKAVASRDSVRRRIWSAAALAHLHQWDSAYAEIAKAKRINSTDAQLKEWLPQFERLQGLLPQIKALDAQIRKTPNERGPLLDRARLFAIAQQPLLALEDSRRAIEIEPESMRARVQAGEALLDLKRLNEAAQLKISHNLARERDGHVADKWLRELSEQDALVLQNPGKAEPLATRAGILRSLNQFTLALADAEAALRINNKLALAHFEAALSLKELNQSRDALAYAVAATELDPNDPASWFYRGLLEAERADFSAAIASQTRSLRRRESLPALREREKCARRLGQIYSANADLTRIRELESAKQ